MTSAILNILHFLLDNDIAPLFPSHITQFNFILAKDTIGIDSLTTTQIIVFAENTPAILELSEVIALLSAISPLGSDRANVVFTEFVDYLDGAAKFMLGIYSSIIAQYEADNPGTDIDNDLFQSPTFYYGPVTVTDPDLVMLMSTDPAIANVDEAAFELRGYSFGKTSIRAEGRGAGDRSKMVIDNALCTGCIYYGAAFGASMPVSITHELNVGRYGKLDVVIDGLPQGLDADVLVIYPDGVQFKHLKSSQVIDKLKPGMYEIQAYDRTSNSGTEYIADPPSQFVTVEGGKTDTATVDYSQIYATIDLTIAGLPDGVDGDVVITGPSNYSSTAVTSIFIDDIEEGIYLITAIDVIEQSSGSVLKPNPYSQNITVTGGDTSVVTVEYGGEYSLRMVCGPNPINQFYGWAEAWTTLAGEYETNNVIGDGSLVYEYPSINNPNIKCIIDGSSGASGSAAASAGGASSSINFTVSGFGNTGGAISMNASAVGTIPSLGNPVEYGCSQQASFAQAGSGLNGTYLCVLLNNPAGDTIDIEFAWAISAVQETNPENLYHWRAIFGLYAQNDCHPNTNNFDGARIVAHVTDTTINPVFSGTEKITTTDTFLRIPLRIGCDASAKGGQRKCWSDENGWNTVYSHAGNAQSSISVIMSSTKR